MGGGLRGGMGAGRGSAISGYPVELQDKECGGKVVESKNIM
jgi:hypothetical protein